MVLMNCFFDFEILLVNMCRYRGGNINLNMTNVPR